MAVPDFIEVYERALDKDACAALIARFEASGHARRGQAGGGVDLAVKNSWDIALDAHPAWSDVARDLNTAVLAGFRHYLRRYAHVALGPVRLQVPDPVSGRRVALDAERVATMEDAALDTLAMALFRPGSINLQKYFANVGGYPYWHSEQFPQPAREQAEALHRVVLWTIYLNDDFDEGETEFLYQSRKIVPRTGALLIAPTAFTHTHRGNMPRSRDKYIATSWILFRRPDPLPPAGGGAAS